MSMPVWKRMDISNRSVSYVNEFIKEELHKHIDFPRLADFDSDVSKSVLVAIGLYMRSLHAHNCRREKDKHPLFYYYCMCLSDESGLGNRIAAARAAGILPKYSAKMAKKWKISKGHTYAGQS